MNNLLEDIINRLKISLKEDSNGIIIGEFNDVIASIEFNYLHLTQYKSFLENKWCKVVEGQELVPITILDKNIVLLLIKRVSNSQQ